MTPKQETEQTVKRIETALKREVTAGTPDPVIQAVADVVTPENLRDIAYRAMMTPAQFRNIMNGTNEPRIGTVRRMVEAAGLSLMVVTGGEV